jgi:tungstate transport system ATP-binding protein
MSSLISLYGIQKKIGQHLLLDIEHLRLEPASAYVLTGINGAGKTSLLRILCGLESASIGNASFLGNDLRWSPYPKILRDAIVYVHQHPIMFSTTVAKNISYGLKARGIPTAHHASAVQHAMQWAGITHLAERQANTLSGGEKQRVALARAKVLRPKLLLLDEPTSNLDGEAREQVLALIPELIKDGSSVMMVCHDRDLIAAPGAHRLKLRDGKLESR